jgi:hypothetical protein
MPERELYACAARSLNAQFAAGLSELGQHVEIAQGEASLVDEIGCQLTHQRGMRAQQRAPGVESKLMGQRLEDEPIEQRGNVGLTR